MEYAPYLTLLRYLKISKKVSNVYLVANVCNIFIALVSKNITSCSGSCKRLTTLRNV